MNKLDKDVIYILNYYKLKYECYKYKSGTSFGIYNINTKILGFGTWCRNNFVKTHTYGHFCKDFLEVFNNATQKI